MMIMNVMFDGNSYGLWERAVRIALKAKNNRIHRWKFDET